MNETWKPVVGYEGYYEISDEGRILGLKSGKILRPAPDRKGYMKCVLQKDGVTKNKRIHRLVLESFVGPCPKNCEGAHIDGDVKNNNLRNLAWKTSAQNKQDQIRHGTLAVCENSKFAVLSNEDVINIRKLRKAGNLWKNIHAKWPSVNLNSIIQAGTGVTFYHLSEPPALRLQRSRAAQIGPKHS